MKLFIHLEIGDWQQRGYDKAWLHFASSLSSDILGTDLDNQSDSMVADLVLKMIDQSALVFLLVEVHQPDRAPGATLAVMEYLSRHSRKVSRVVFTGSYPVAESVISPLGEKRVVESDQARIQEMIKVFAR